MDYPKMLRKLFFRGYLRVIVFLSNIIINMINYYDEKNVLTFDERTQTRMISIEVKKEEEKD
jgi:hypothetical protein